MHARLLSQQPGIQAGWWLAVGILEAEEGTRGRLSMPCPQLELSLGLPCSVISLV